MSLRQAFIPVFTLIICVSVIFQWTRGLKTFTIFSYTLDKADPVSKTFPDMTLIDHNGEVFNIKDNNKYTLVNFVYLSCPEVCHKVNNQLEELYHLPKTSQFFPSELQFLTISFDTENDDVDRIDKYRKYFISGEIDNWSFALPYKLDHDNFIQDLNSIGVWIYQNPESYLINHSIYLYLLSPDQKIVKIFDPARENSKDIINQIEECIEKV